MNFTFLQFLLSKNIYVELEQKKWNFFLYISVKKNSSVFNLTRNLKLETFDHGTFLYKVHELLLITFQVLWASFYTHQSRGTCADEYLCNRMHQMEKTE